ncbi:MAG: DNRLRE domain-containing protein [Deltaproteobacteria bacterium]|nr:DNRLRE domain-containing protein [Deltaproteobacteria bacterium]
MRPSHLRTALRGHAALPALALALAIPALSARADTLVIQPSNQDAFVMKSFPNRVTGTRNTRLRVEASPANKIRRALVQFPLGSIPPGATVSSAAIELYASVNAQSSTLTHALHRVTAPWQENTVKWNTLPPFAAAPSATALVGDGRGFKTFDVTADVQSAINRCSDDHGWLIKDAAETATNLDLAYISQEEKHPADIGNRPRLTVTFTPPPCATDADCRDANFCTTNERCEAGACVVDPVQCDDGNPCTADVCDCAIGCRPQAICDDGFACTTDGCDPTKPEAEWCTHTPNDGACATGCSDGACVGDPDRGDLDPVTGCFVTSVEPAGTPCSDGQTCTAPDQCDGSGACVPGPKDCGAPGCGGSAVCAEDCGNCVDDDGDGFVDRRDPQCAPLVDGGGQGVGDPKFRGKPVVRCQKAIRAAGSQFGKQLRTRLQKCADGVFLCLQQKPGDAACLAKARARCLKQTAPLSAGPATLDQRLGAKIAKACGPKKPGLLPVVPGTDVCGATGLGFAGDVAACATPQSAALLSAVTSAIAEAHRCRTVQLFTTDVPRAHELLGAGGVDLSALPCLAAGAQGGNLGLGKPAGVAKAVVGCQRGIGAAGARFVKQVLDAEQRCAETVAQCIQTRPGDAKCLARARGVCRKVTSKLYQGAQSREAKLKAAIARACGSTAPGKAPRVALGDLRSVLGLGYDTLQPGCAALGVAGLASIGDVSECLVREHVCRADQLLTSQTPRAHELLGIGQAAGR